MEEALGKLEIYPLSHQLAIEVHRMSFKLPFFEQHEEAPQVRRASKRVSANIVEGFSQRKYKGQYLIYLYRALGSADETQEHLQLLHKTGSLKDAALYAELLKSYERLSGKIFNFIQTVESRHEKPHYLRKDPSKSGEQDSVVEDGDEPDPDNSL